MSDPLFNSPATGPITQDEKSKKLVAGLLAIFLGGLAIHKFYLGYQKEGIIQIVINVVSCGMLGVLALIEGIIYLTKSDEDFVNTYVRGRKGWF